MVKIFIVVILLLVSSSNVSARVVINEFSSSGSADWVEIYNDGTASASLSEYKLTDDKNQVISWGGEVSIEPEEYKTFDTNKLNQDGDALRLYKINGEEELVEEIKYGMEGNICAPGGGQSIGRNPDTNGGFVRLVNQTKGGPNSTEVAACSTPTPELTKTPSPTPVPTKSPTPTPLSTSTPTPKPAVLSQETTPPPGTSTPRPKRTATPRQTAAPRREAPETEATPSPSSAPEEEARNSSVPPVAIVSIAGGVGLIGAAATPALRNYWYNRKVNGQG